jgi:phospholipase C
VPLDANDQSATTPIQHVVVIIGENRTFDHIYGAYRPRPGEKVLNLLSQGIIKFDGTPGPKFDKAAQFTAQVTSSYTPAPSDQKTAYLKLPPVFSGGNQTASDTNGPPFQSLDVAAEADAGLLPPDLLLLLTGATGLPSGVVDTRMAEANNLPNGPYQLTPGIPYDAYAGSPVHRFYQMWQQVDCSAAHATAKNPSGCLSDLFPWVETTVGAGSNGKPQPANFNDHTTHEGSISMGFYNVNNGDAPYLKFLADTYALSDNYHQAIQGGTGANHVAIGTGDAIWYSDGKGNPATPPFNEIENPNPQPGTNNFYTQDGYSGGTYSACADSSQPGVGPVVTYLNSISYKPKPNCEADHYYLLNNYNPGYFGNGDVDTVDKFTIPPSNLRTIGDALGENKVSWRYYGESWNDYVQDPSASPYCNICNPFQYTSSVMTNAASRIEHLKDTTDLYNDIRDDTLPAVSFVKPNGLNDGHPASSKLDLFEAFVRKIELEIRQNPAVWQSTAILVTFDEGGGYWDSGYIQPVDFFGDGTRVPLLAISPYSKRGEVVHTYYDHVSILKFIERNWGLQPLTHRSRDNLPNPTATDDNPYVPTNGPAIGDLMEMFHF